MVLPGMLVVLVVEVVMVAAIDLGSNHFFNKYDIRLGFQVNHLTGD